MRATLLLLLLGCLLPFNVFSATEVMQEHDPVSAVVFWVTLIFTLSLCGRYIAKQFNQAGVLGELLMGVLIGNLLYFLGVQLFVVLREGSAVFEIMRNLLHDQTVMQAVNNSISNPKYAAQVLKALSSDGGTDLIKVAYVLDIFSRYGVIFLLFMVGLESSFQDIRQTGKESVMVAVIGVAAPILLGFAVAHMFLPQSDYKTDLFVAATLCATSIGITARVLTEMNKLRTREARTILGAAMLDDILGLIILAIVSSIVVSGTIDGYMILQVVVSAFFFFAGALLMGPWVLARAVKFFYFLDVWEAKLIVSFIFVMGLAWLATLVQLASIIGAFAAGLIIHDGYFETEEGKQDRFNIRDLVAPFESIMAPIFFILIGIQVKLESFFDWRVMLLATALIIAAVLGKLISGLGASKKDDRLLIGIGMLPRGEVGLVFASIGRTLGVINDQLFSAIILMVIITTLMAPPWLKQRYNKHKQLSEA